MAQASQRTWAWWAWWAATALGWVLIAAWACWWGIALFNGNAMFASKFMRVPAWQYLGFDFEHNYLASRAWLIDGINPYLTTFGDWRGLFGYPPIVLPLFAWTVAVPKLKLAYLAWITFIAAAVSCCAWMATRMRESLGLTRLPLVFVLGLVLCSAPVLFAMERGQSDVLVLAMIILASLALRARPSWTRDLLVGVCLAVATWVKIYPGILLFGLIALREWRALQVSVVAAVCIGLVPWRATELWIGASAASQGDRINFVSEVASWLTDSNYQPAQLKGYPAISTDSHSLTTFWGWFWPRYSTVGWIWRVPGVVGAALILLPLAIWVSLRMLRAPYPVRLALPYLLWLTALATFAMPVSYDYNLLFLPLAAVAVMDRRDPWPVGVAMLALLAWWQPFAVPGKSAPEALMLLKLISLAGVGLSIVVRARAQQPHPRPQPRPAPQPAPQPPLDREQPRQEVIGRATIAAQACRDRLGPVQCPAPRMN